MTLEEAIKRLRELSVPGSPDLEKDDFRAINLGIEALKRIQDCRHDRNLTIYPLLPSENSQADPGESGEVYRGMTETMFINPERD